MAYEVRITPFGECLHREDNLEVAKSYADDRRSIGDKDQEIVLVLFEDWKTEQPTAEWSRIQQLMKEHEWMKRCLVSMGVLCGESGDLCRFVGENNDTLQRISEEDTSIFPQAVGYSERISMKEIESLKKQIKLLKQHPNGGPGANAITAERLRQLESEGWWPDHDDKWTHQELAQAAIPYIYASTLNEMREDPIDCGWPWDIEWFKPFKEKEPENSYDDRNSYEVDRIRCLEKAGALIAAEIDRLKRKEARPKAGCDHCTDPDGVCCYPTYGMAPHKHDMNKTGSAIGSTVFLPRSEWPDNFDPDPDAEGCGTWTHCPKCGAPDHQDLFEKRGE